MTDLFPVEGISHLPEIVVERDQAFMDSLNAIDPGQGGAIAVKFWLPNGWGVSCVRSPYNYSGEDTAELAVISRDPENPGFWDLNFDSGFANDILGWQTPGELVALLVKLNTLPVRKALSTPQSVYDECGCYYPCPDHSPAAEGALDRAYWDDRYDCDPSEGDDR